MDIFTIIKEGLPELPEGVTISEKAIKAIEKEIKTQQGLEFIPKAQYAKKTERIDELEAELNELRGKAADGESYKEKYEAELLAHAETKETLQKEFNDFKETIEAEKTTAAKKDALRKQLLSDGAHSKAVDLLELKFDISKIKLEGDKIKEWDTVSKPVKEQYADFFGETVVEGINPANPPANTQSGGDEFVAGLFGNKKK